MLLRFCARYRLLALVGVALLGVLAAMAARGEDWPAYQHDVHHTGRSSASFDPEGLALAWKAPTGYTTPLIVGDSVIASRNPIGFGSGATHVTSFRLSDGAINWEHIGDYAQSSQPACGEGLVVFVAVERSNNFPKLVVLDAGTGAFKYAVPLNVGSWVAMPTVHRNPANGYLMAYAASNLTLDAVRLEENSGTILWSQNGEFGGSSIPTIAGGSVVLAGPGQYYAFDLATGEPNHFHIGNLYGSGGTTVAFDPARSQLYVLEAYNDNWSGVLTAYRYVDNRTITRIWQKTGAGARGSGSVAIGADGKIYAVDGTTLVELEPATGAVLRSLDGQGFDGALTPMLSDGYLWVFHNNLSLLVYELSGLAPVRAFPGSHGSPNSTFDSPGALDDAHFLLDYGWNVQAPGFDVYAAPQWTCRDVSVGSDNRPHPLWRHSSGAISLHTLSPTGGFETYVQYGPYAGWRATALATGPDNKTRVIWRHSSGAISLHTLSSTGQFESYVQYGPFEGWEAIGLGVGSDSKTRLLWRHVSGAVSLVLLSPGGQFESYVQHGPYEGWTAQGLSVGWDNKTRLLWTHGIGAVSLHTLSPTGQLESYVQYGPFAGWTPRAVATGSDNKTRLLWTNENGAVSLHRLSPGSQLEGYVQYGPFAGWKATSLAVGGDNKTRLLWTHGIGALSLHTLSPAGDFESYVQYGPF